MEFYYLNRGTWLVIVVSLAVALAAALIRT
jgi:hypothetical protein